MMVASALGEGQARGDRRRATWRGAAGRQMTCLAVLVLLSAGWCLVGPPPAAMAATVSIENGRAVYVSSPGEWDYIALGELYTEPVVLDFHSTTALEAGTGCQQADASSASCPLVPADMLLLDGSDTVLHFGRHTVAVQGGDGDDRVVNGPGPTDVSGGPDADAMEYHGFSPQGKNPVTVTLDDQPNDGETGEGDNVRSDVERVLGSEAGDRLIGNSLANAFDGGPGNDAIDGLGGTDSITGGAGEDAITSLDGNVDAVDCGGGTDSVNADPSDKVIACERVFQDADGDGAAAGTDCDDANAAVRPGATDVPDNGIDEDCSGADAVGVDRDRDGYARPPDCDDVNAAIHPGAFDRPDNGIDENCDGVDLHDLDRDRDGYARPADCDDANAAIHPDARERPRNRNDEDCDGRDGDYASVGADIKHAEIGRGSRTAIRRLAVVGAPAKGSVAVRCRGGGCPFARRSIAATPGRRMALTRLFKGSWLAPGSVVKVTVKAPRMYGKRLRLRTRNGQRPVASWWRVDPVDAKVAPL